MFELLTPAKRVKQLAFNHGLDRFKVDSIHYQPSGHVKAVASMQLRQRRLSAAFKWSP